MNKTLFGILALTGLLASGCTALSGKPEQKASTATAYNDTPIISHKIRPEYERESEAIFLIMQAELAGQRGNLALAVKNYLKAAQISKNPKIAERALRLASFAQDYASTTAAAERWVELQPDDLSVRQTLAILYLRSGRKAEAVAQIEKVLQLSSREKYHGFGRVASLLAREKDQQNALDIMANLVKAHDKDPYALFAYASLALQFKRDKLAEEQVSQALKIKPDFDEAVTLYSRILMSQGKTKQALDLTKQLVEKKPDNRSHRLSYARLLTSAKQYDNAMKQFDYLLKKSPRDADVLYPMALLSMEQKKYSKAEEYFTRLLKTGRRTDQAYYYLGGIAENKKQYDKAIQWYTRVRHGDDLVNAQIRIARILSLKGDIEGARSYLEKLHALYPHLDVRLYITEIDLLMESGNPQEAMTVANEALKNHPGDNDLLYSRSLVAEKLDKLDMVEQDLKTVLKKDPENAHALNALGYTLADRTTRFQEAMQYLQKAIKISPDEPAFLDSMGWLLYRMGKHNEALGLLERAYKGYTDDEVAAHLIEVLLATGKHDRAREIWIRATKDDPKSSKLKKFSKRFK